MVVWGAGRTETLVTIIPGLLQSVMFLCPLSKVTHIIESLCKQSLERLMENKYCLVHMMIFFLIEFKGFYFHNFTILSV